MSASLPSSSREVERRRWTSRAANLLANAIHSVAIARSRLCRRIPRCCQSDFTVDRFRWVAPGKAFYRSRPPHLRLHVFGFFAFAVTLLVHPFGHGAPGRSLDRICSGLRGSGRLCERASPCSLMGSLHVIRPPWTGLVRIRVGSPIAGNRLSRNLPVPSHRRQTVPSTRTTAPHPLAV